MHLSIYHFYDPAYTHQDTSIVHILSVYTIRSLMKNIEHKYSFVYKA